LLAPQAASATSEKTREKATIAERCISSKRMGARSANAHG
jgi:hypothetical protein